MLEKLKSLSRKYAEIEYMLSQSEVWADAQKAAALSREKAELTPLMDAYARYEAFRREAESAEELLSDPEMKDLARETLIEARAGMDRVSEELKILLLPKDPDDGKNVIVEIRGGVGGEESALFAADLFRMYEMYAERKGFSVEIVNRCETELGGIREIDFIVGGTNAFSRFRFESGVHRVQRVPETETQGRIHTSTCTGRAAGAGRDRVSPRPRRTADRYVPLLRRGRAEGQQDLERYPRDAFADRHGRRVPGRAQPV